MALTLQQVREKNPRYANLNDDDLVSYLHEKYYSDLPFKDFANAVGYEDPNAPGDMSRGATAAWEGTKQTGYGLMAAAGAVGEKTFGQGGLSTGVKQAGLEGYREKQKILEENAAETDDLTTSWDRAKQGDLGALVDWAQYGLGYAGVQGLQMLATAGVGSVAAKAGTRAVAGEVVEKMVAKETAKLAATGLTGDMLTQEATKLVADKLGRIGAMSVMGAQSFGMEAGDIGGDLADSADKEGKQLTGDQIAKGFGMALGAGAIDLVGDKFGLDVLTGKSKLFKAVQGAEGLSGKAGRAAFGAVAAAPVEGATEYAQTLMEESGKGNDPFSEESRTQAINAAGLGAIGGAAFGVGGGLLSSHMKAAKDQQDEGMREIAGADNVDDMIAGMEKATSWNAALPELVFDKSGTSYNKADLLRGFMGQGADQQTAEEYISRIIGSESPEQSTVDLSAYRELQARNAQLRGFPNPLERPEQAGEAFNNDFAFDDSIPLNSNPDINADPASWEEADLAGELSQPQTLTPQQIEARRRLNALRNQTPIQTQAAEPAPQPTSSVQSQEGGVPPEFSPTHTLSDGTPARFDADENGYIDAQGNVTDPDGYEIPLQELVNEQPNKPATVSILPTTNSEKVRGHIEGSDEFNTNTDTDRGDVYKNGSRDKSNSETGLANAIPPPGSSAAPDNATISQDQGIGVDSGRAGAITEPGRNGPVDGGIGGDAGGLPQGQADTGNRQSARTLTGFTPAETAEIEAASQRPNVNLDRWATGRFGKERTKGVNFTQALSELNNDQSQNQAPQEVPAEEAVSEQKAEDVLYLEAKLIDLKWRTPKENARQSVKDKYYAELRDLKLRIAKAKEARSEQLQSLIKQPSSTQPTTDAAPAENSESQLNETESTGKSIEQQIIERTQERKAQEESLFGLLPASVKRGIRYSEETAENIKAGRYVDGGYPDDKTARDAKSYRNFKQKSKGKAKDAVLAYERKMRKEVGAEAYAKENSTAEKPPTVSNNDEGLQKEAKQKHKIKDKYSYQFERGMQEGAANHALSMGLDAQSTANKMGVFKDAERNAFVKGFDLANTGEYYDQWKSGANLTKHAEDRGEVEVKRDDPTFERVGKFTPKIPAIHIEGQTKTKATQEEVTDAIKKAAERKNWSKSQMRDWLVSEIDKAIETAESFDVDKAILNKAEYLAQKNFPRLNKFDLAKKTAELVDTVDTTGYLNDFGQVTLDVPGDGRFKILNTKQHLEAFKQKVLASPGFKESRDVKGTRQPSTKQADVLRVAQQYIGEANRAKSNDERDEALQLVSDIVRNEGYSQDQIDDILSKADSISKARFNEIMAEGSQKDDAGNNQNQESQQNARADSGDDATAVGGSEAPSTVQAQVSAAEEGVNQSGGVSIDKKNEYGAWLVGKIKDLPPYKSNTPQGQRQYEINLSKFLADEFGTTSGQAKELIHDVVRKATVGSSSPVMPMLQGYSTGIVRELNNRGLIDKKLSKQIEKPTENVKQDEGNGKADESTNTDAAFKKFLSFSQIPDGSMTYAEALSSIKTKMAEYQSFIDCMRG